jgi:hypothetical protein
LSDLVALFEQAFRLARERLTLFAAVVAILSAAGSAVDLAPDSATFLLTILFTLLTLFLETALSASALQLDPVRTAGRNFVPVFGLSLFYGVGVSIGLFLLVVPGLVLLLRWSISLPVLLAEKSGVMGSLRRSWELTTRRWGLAIAISAAFVLAQGPLILLYFLTSYPAMPVPVVMAVNVYVSLLIALQWLLAVALYRLVRGEIPDTSLPMIFS